MWWTLTTVYQTTWTINNHEHRGMMGGRNRGTRPRHYGVLPCAIRTPPFPLGLKGRQCSIQSSWLITSQRKSQRAQNTNNTKYMYLNGGDYFCGIYPTWNTAYRPGRLVQVQYSRNCIHTVPNDVSWSPQPRYRNEGCQRNTPFWSTSHLIRRRTISTAETPAVQTFLRLIFQAYSETVPQHFKAQWLAYAPPRSTQESLHFVHAVYLHIPHSLSIKSACFPLQHWQLLIMEAHCVICAVRTESLLQCILTLAFTRPCHGAGS
jgi:hypothetical protein